MPAAKTPMIKNTTSVGIEFGINPMTKIEIAKSDKCDYGGGDMTTGYDSDNWISTYNNIAIDLENAIGDLVTIDYSYNAPKACFPNDPISIVCDLKNKRHKNSQIVPIFETFINEINGPNLEYHIENSILECFYNPSDAAKEKAYDIKSHFESKFTISTLKSKNGNLSKTRRQILEIIQNDYTSQTSNSISLPLLTTIPDLYDEDLNLEYLQNNFKHQKSDYAEFYVDNYPNIKTLYPALSTYRGGFRGFEKPYTGFNYFWVDEYNLLYKINATRTNNLKPFIDYFFSKEKVDFVIHKQKIDKIPSFDLFFYDIKNFSLAEIMDI